MSKVRVWADTCIVSDLYFHEQQNELDVLKKELGSRGAVRGREVDADQLKKYLESIKKKHPDLDELEMALTPEIFLEVMAFLVVYFEHQLKKQALENTIQSYERGRLQERLRQSTVSGRKLFDEAFVKRWPKTRNGVKVSLVASGRVFEFFCKNVGVLEWFCLEGHNSTRFKKLSIADLSLVQKVKTGDSELVLTRDGDIARALRSLRPGIPEPWGLITLSR